MLGDRARLDGWSEARFISSVLVVTGAFYPFWHLLAPPASFDPWAVWWAIGAYKVLVGALGSRYPVVRDRLRFFLYGDIWMIVAHLAWLSALNFGEPFYALGSVFAVVFAAFMIPTRAALLCFAGYVFVVSEAVFRATGAPWPLHLAVSGACLVVLGVAYKRLARRLAAEREAARNRESLERLVAERTRELSEQTDALARANAQLRRQMEERERLEEQLRRAQKLDALGRLAGGVAHDFNNLLTAITGYAEVLRAGLPEGSALRDDAEQICQVADRATGITNQLLAFSRHPGVGATVIELDVALGELARLLIGTMGEHTTTQLRLGAPGCGIRIHRSQLDQILLNLCVNARDAMPEGGVLTIETSNLGREDATPWHLGLEADRRVVLRVTDTGRGMPPETASRAFDPFFTTKEVGKGTGLGLSIVYGIVQQTGGQIHLESEPGRGTRFEISWPVAAKPAEAEVSSSPEPRSSGGSERILVVEDERWVRHLVHRVLESGGYRVLEAADAESALRIVSEERDPIDLMVTDVVMPRMSGIELARRLEQERPELKVLFISGHLDHPSLREGELPLGSLLLPKPFQPKELGAMVRDLLDRPAATRP